MMLRRIVLLLFIATCGLTAFADSVTFSGGPAGLPYYANLSGAGVFTLVAPITSLTAGGTTYADNAVFFLQSAAPTSSDTTNHLYGYSSGIFGMYLASDWNFSTQSANAGATALMGGALGTSLAGYLLPDPNGSGYLLSYFLGNITSGGFGGSFGGFDLTKNNPIVGGNVLNVSVDFALNDFGLFSVPLATQIVTTPEPSSISLLLGVFACMGLLYRRRRALA